MGGSPWALDKGRTKARPAARALGNWLPQFCILSSEKCRDSTLTGPWRAIGHGTCSCACTSVPSLPILHRPSGCLPLGDPQASQIQQGSAPLCRKWQQWRPTASVRISLILLPPIPRSRSGSDGQGLAGTSPEGSAPHSHGSLEIRLGGGVYAQKSASTTNEGPPITQGVRCEAFPSTPLCWLFRPTESS